ncbi:Alpha/Beta hydrolase protein [Lipomyces japonicus]|uniref:Alpha/Beta hydrolase protein n=1 Tax=Lipomyces japonicus TaxID=56871 RepID=UPI0034CF2E3C
MTSSLPCKDCITGTIHKGTPLGLEVKLFDTDAYLAPVPESVNGVIIFVTDLFGWKLPNSRLLADAYAKEGNYKVYVPDFFPWQPIPLESIDAFAPYKPSASPAWYSSAWKIAKSSPGIVSFLIASRPSVTTPKIAKFVEQVKAAEPNLPVFVVGFCWGGRYSLILATDRVKAGTIAAVAALHPSMVSFPDDIKATTVPVTIGIGSKDTITSISSIEKIKNFYLQHNVESEVKVYDDMIHGFAVRGDIEREVVATAMADAKTQVLTWFKKHELSQLDE